MFITSLSTILLVKYIFRQLRTGVGTGCFAYGTPAQCLIDISTPANRYVASTIFEVLISLRWEQSLEILIKCPSPTSRSYFSDE